MKVIDNVVIDTGAAESIISPDVVEDIGIFAGQEDNINSFYKEPPGRRLLVNFANMHAVETLRKRPAVI